MKIVIVILHCLLGHIPEILGSNWAVSHLSKEDSNITSFVIPKTSIKVTIFDTHIIHIPSGIFNHLLSCKQLYLSLNKIRLIYRNSFLGLVRLEELFLNDNEILNLEPGTFRNLTQLQKLHLGNNNLMELKNGTFDSLENLLFLHLENNRLGLVESGAIRGAFKLEDVSFNGNNLRELPGELFKDSSRLSLFVQSNQLLTIPENLFGEKLTYLNFLFNGNEIISLSPIFKKCHILESIQLRIDGNISIPANLFENLSMVKDITLLSAGNSLVLPSQLFRNLTYLNRVVLKVGLPDLQADLFQGLSSVIHLHLQYTLLETIASGALHHLTGIRTLYIDSNPLSSLTYDSFQGLHQMTTLIMHSNELQTLPSGLFRGLNKLSAIDFGVNKIWSLPSDIFQNLPALTGVWLASNRLTSIPANIFHNSPLINHIDLSYNNLQVIELVLPDYPQHINVELVGNPTECNKNICWMLYRNSSSKAGARGGVCDTPPTLNGRKLSGLQPSDIEGCTGLYLIN